jgi:transposase-like protein
MKKKVIITKEKLRPRRVFSEEFKRQKVKEIEENQIRVSEVCRIYDVSDVAVYKWIYKYSIHLKKGIKQVVEFESESERSKKLQTRIAELERVVGQKQMEIDFLEKVIEIGSEELEVDIKKKFSTTSSSGSKSTEKSTDIK